MRLEEEEPHSYNYAMGCDVGIDCVANSEVTSGKLKETVLNCCEAGRDSKNRD